jgi:hypothetical protein
VAAEGGVAERGEAEALAVGFFGEGGRVQGAVGGEHVGDVEAAAGLGGEQGDGGPDAVEVGDVGVAERGFEGATGGDGEEELGADAGAHGWGGRREVAVEEGIDGGGMGAVG